MDPTTPGWNAFILLIIIGVAIKWIFEKILEVRQIKKEAAEEEKAKRQ